MADQFNDSIPSVTNQVTEDIADIAETLGYIKDVFQNFCYNWSNTVATQVFPNKMNDDDEVLINIAGSEVISVNASGYDVLSIPQGLDVTAAINRKIVEIGDWDMDANATTTVAHGLGSGNFKKIRGVTGIIRNDADTTYYPITRNNVSGESEMGISSIDNTVITIARFATGNFDTSAFDATGYNRGWLVIEYVN